MQPVTVSASGTGAASTSAAVILDPYVNDGGGVGLGVAVTGTVAFTVEHTYDNLFNVATSSATWYNNTGTSLVSGTANAQGSFAVVPFAVRIKNASGAGTAALTVITQGLQG